MFGRLGAGQRMPAWEQAPARPGRIRQAAAVLAKAAAVMAAAGAGASLICAVWPVPHRVPPIGDAPAVVLDHGQREAQGG